MQLVVWLASSWLLGCGFGANEPGTFSITFNFVDAAPSGEVWAQGRVERTEGDRVQVAEARAVRLTEQPVLAFPRLPHGGPYRVIVELRGTSDERARVLYFGESKPFYVRKGKHTQVEVALALTASPSAGDPVDAVQVVERNARGFVRNSKVTLSLAPEGATQVRVANDISLTREAVALAGLSRDGERYLLPWDLDQDLCTTAACPDGTRVVYVQFENERGYVSDVLSTEVEIDRSVPSVAAASLTPLAAGVGTTVTLVVNASEPLPAVDVPTLRVTPRNPGFGAFSSAGGNAFVATYIPTGSEDPREQFSFFVGLTDAAGNTREQALELSLLVDVQPPGLTRAADVVPPVVRDGDPFSLTFELDEVTKELPVVRVGSTEVDCLVDGPSYRAFRCTHTVRAVEGSGERAIVIAARDVAGNLALLDAGHVLYDTLPRCGDGVINAELLEICDDGEQNSSVADAACREDCRPQRCGDGVVDPLHDEVCDDGNRVGGDGCASDCRSNERCANGVLDLALGEACDDGNLLSHDGCSSACQRERLRSTRGSFPDSIYSLATYDTRRERVLVFGEGALFEVSTLGVRRVSPPIHPDVGDAECLVFDAARGRTLVWAHVGDHSSLWEWDGSSWQERPRGARALTERLNPAAVYMTAAERTLFFGGESNTGAQNDLWAWDGTYWTEVLPEGDARPAARSGAAMAYDPERNRVVLFGGTDDGDDFDDTWEWDGTRWHEMAPSGSGPVWPSSVAMTYDASRKRVVLRDGDGVLWTWDGIAWTELWSFDEDAECTDRPGAFYQPDVDVLGALVYDARLPRLLTTDGDDIWSLSGLSWTPIVAYNEGPVPAVGHAAAYDATRGRGLVFGGYVPSDQTCEDEGYALDGTWAWSQGMWSLLETPGDVPSPRVFAALAHDNLRGISVLFGGQSDGEEPCEDECSDITLFGDTWEFDGASWRRAAVQEDDSPPAGGLGVLVYDRARSAITLFAPSSEGTLGVWFWDGARWAQRSVSGERPGARTRFAAAYDVVRERVVLFGGELDPTTQLDDTWEWDGQRFYDLRSAASPGARSRHSLTYHATRGTVLLSGGAQGEELTSDVWEWDGSTWHELEAVSTSAAHEGRQAFFDPSSHAVVAFGGYEMDDDERDTALATRLLYFDSASPCAPDEIATCPPVALDETCVVGVDGDGDGLIGCADPDCYGRCSPGCNPALMSCNAVASGRPLPMEVTP